MLKRMARGHEHRKSLEQSEKCQKGQKTKKRPKKDEIFRIFGLLHGEFDMKEKS